MNLRAGSMRRAGRFHIAGALWNVAWKYLLVHRWQSVLMVLGISLGVAMVISIDLANASAARAFTMSAELVTGKTTHQIEGGPRGVEESLYARLRRDGVVKNATPVISEYASSPQLGSRPMQLMGIDPFSDAPFRHFLGRESKSSLNELAGLTAFFSQPGAVLISKPLAEQYGIRPGDSLALSIAGHPREAVVAGLLVPADELSQHALEGLILADISTAQELTGSTGFVSRIDLILPENDPDAAQRLSQWLPPGYRIVPAAERSGTIQQMVQAFQLNLTALSLLALVVGLFLIYNTITFSVVQRRELFGTLRCLGVTRAEIFTLVISEAVIVGVLGALIGTVLGVLLGQITVRMVTQTVNDLYFVTTVQPVGLPWESLAKGSLLGLLASVFTAALPAWEASTIPPRAALLRSGLEGKVRRSLGKIALAGLFSGIAGVGCFVLPSSSVVVGFAGTLFVVVGFALFSSVSLLLLMRLLSPLTGWLFGFIGRLAPRNLVSALSRTSVAVAALMVAVAVIIGVGLMIDSFRSTVVVWLEQTLQRDVYISVPGTNATRSFAPIDPQIIAVVKDWPGVARMDTLRQTTVESSIGRINLSATTNPDIGKERLFSTLEGSQATVWQGMNEGEILLSEPLANRLGMKRPGQDVRLLSEHGWQSFRVMGIYYDYSSSEGTVLMARDVYRGLWDDPSITALGLLLEPGNNADSVARALQDRIAGQQELLIRPNKILRRDVLEVFDRTFAITVALRVLATGVAFVGVLNALLLLQMEKQREVGILRTLGLTGPQLRRLVMVETGLMGLAAGLFAIPAGLSLAYILVFVINRRSFGWTLHLSIQPEVFLQALIVAVLAALLAGIFPAWRMSRMSAAEVIRYE